MLRVSNYPPWGHFLQQWTKVVGGLLFNKDQSPRVFLLKVRKQSLSAQTQFLFVLHSLSSEAGLMLDTILFFSLRGNISKAHWQCVEANSNVWSAGWFGMIMCDCLAEHTPRQLRLCSVWCRCPRCHVSREPERRKSGMKQQWWVVCTLRTKKARNAN